MDVKFIILRILTLLAVCEARQMKPTGEAPTRRGPWRQKASLSISVSKGQRAKPPMQPSKVSQNNKITHSVSLQNLNLAPGEAKVIKQTLVVRRRRPNANKKKTNSKSPGNRKRGGSQKGSRFDQGSGQRGVSPSAPQSRNLFLLSKLHPTQKASVQSNGMATLHLPVIHINGPVPAGQFSVSGNTGNAHSHHRNMAPDASNNVFGAPHSVDNIHGGIPGNRLGGSATVNDFTHSGINQVDIASALLAGNPEVVVLQDTASTPVPVSTAGGLGPLPAAAGHGTAYSAAFHVRSPAATFRVVMPAHAAHNTHILHSSLIRDSNYKPSILSTRIFGDSNYQPNILSTNLMRSSNYSPVQYSNQASGNSKLNSQRKTNSVLEKHTLSPVLTTLEPGEDPPELK